MIRSLIATLKNVSIHGNARHININGGSRLAMVQVMNTLQVSDKGIPDYDGPIAVKKVAVLSPSKIRKAKQNLTRRPPVSEEWLLKKKQSHNVHDAVKLLKEWPAKPKFVETVELAVTLGVDPRKPNQAIRSMARLPHGTGKTIRIAVFAQGEEAKAAIAAGADVVGADDLIKAIQGGEINFDRVISTPEMMAQVGKIGRILGPKGLMPNPKMGTVSTDVAKAVKAAKAGSVTYRVDKQGVIHCGIGKMTFSEESIVENIRALMISINEAKPELYKGKYLVSVHLTSSMGPGLKIDLPTVDPSNGRFMLEVKLATAA